ncbi:hypothetical protein OG782_22805 [Streptomyces sp. NBC_00876]|uniref:hypothetical protein n=1 Tax=Streptomyces sp. NBC_00876 TaxID=2975853 RepID=UPI003866E276|nr:hypothetical protein OG782_22805 [Streptomyces sp. NBC_00876]
MRRSDTGSDTDSELDSVGSSRTGGGPWAAAGANLALGVLATFPGMCVHWLMTEYLPMDCGSQGTRGTGCDPDIFVSASFYMWGAGIGGLVVLALLVIVDVLMPRQEGWPRRLWLGMAVLVPVPFVVGLALGRF